eukprot:Colp12_sorted_trinity150504_noHs@18665
MTETELPTPSSSEVGVGPVDVKGFTKKHFDSFAQKNPEFFQEYILEHAGANIINAWLDRNPTYATRLVQKATPAQIGEWFQLHPEWNQERCCAARDQSFAPPGLPRRQSQIGSRKNQMMANLPRLASKELVVTEAPTEDTPVDTFVQTTSDHSNTLIVSGVTPKKDKTLSAREIRTAATDSQKGEVDVSKLKGLQTKDLLIELVRDIGQELDLITLVLKILKNVVILLKGDRCSLFLVDNSGQNLVSKVFDVTMSTTMEDVDKMAEIVVPLGQGIVGHTAKSGEVVNIADAYQDPRFRQDVDKRTGYRTKTILCVPIRNVQGEIIGVSQVVNKENGDLFTKEDEENFQTFLQFCAIAIRNAQLFDLSVTSCERSEVLLSLAKSIFQEVDMKVLIKKIMEHAAELVNAERCSVFLVDNDTNELYSTVFDVDSTRGGENKEAKAPVKEIRFPMSKGIAGFVASTGQTLNIADAYKDARFNQDVDKETGFRTKSILCMPIM